MAVPMFTISNARQKFFALFQAVTRRKGHRVVIASRGSADHAVLIGESYFNELEAAARRLRNIEGDSMASAGTFRIIGSARIMADDPVAELRLAAGDAAGKKLASVSRIP